MADFYFGSSSPDFAASWSQYGGGSGTSVLNKDAALTLTVPAGGITITELQRGMDSAAGQAGTTVQIGVYDITGNPANPPLLGSATINSRSDNAGYVWHTVSGLNINVAAGKVIAIGSALPSTAVWHTRGAEISDAGAASTTLPSPWSGPGSAREIPLRAGYSLNTPPATIYDINGNNIVRVGSTGNSISTAGIGTLTGITLGGKAATNLNAPGGDGTFDMPGFVDGASYSLMGSVTGTASDGTNSDDIPATLYPPEGYDFVTLAGTLNTSNTGVLYQFSPAAVAGDQIVFPLAITVDAQGNVDGDAGTYTLYEIRASDGVVRTVALTLGAAGSDTTPDAFGFNTPALAALGATVTSTNTTISGINAAAAVSVTGGLVSINGGAFVSSGTITNGQTIAARVTASNSYSTAVTATVNIGGVSAQFTATTIADPGPPPDTTPDLITFPPSTNCAAGSAQASAVRSITGINQATPVTAATNCTYSIAGGAATSANGSISNGQTIQLFAVASGTPGATVNASITIGGQVFTWAITTAQPKIIYSTQGGVMSGDPRLNVLQKLVANILAALGAGGTAATKPPDDETYQGSISQAGVALKQNINGWNSFIATWSATAGNHTIIIEGNETGLDNDQWYALSGTPIDIASAGSVASRPVVGGSYSGFVYPKRFPWVRVRVSAYGGGGATINCRLTVSCNTVSSAPYVTTITGMANNNNPATAGGPSPYFVTCGGITRPSNQITDTSGVSTPFTFSAGGQLSVKPYSVSESDWNFTVAAGGIVSSASAQPAKAAAGAGIRNFVTWIDVSHDTLSAATELMVLSGSTVIYRLKLQTAASEGKLISLPTPLKGGVNEAINIQLSASVTGGVFVSCGGYSSV